MRLFLSIWIILQCQRTDRKLILSSSLHASDRTKALVTERGYNENNN